MTKVLIEQNEGLTVDYRVVDGDAEVLFIDYSEIKARAEDDDIAFVREQRYAARKWDLDLVVASIDEICEEAGFKIL